eukprot:TRINITY_DN18230_c0_g1_i4.p1 TRINITY_DN18230_c0_g1~~TRINITY_DN18230_c0_g1_i4.p1  ORF type:complete len:436 (-),score=79.79 TRINITY_DN18230_c0_g1_i4:345-1652(-)
MALATDGGKRALAEGTLPDAKRQQQQPHQCWRDVEPVRFELARKRAVDTLRQRFEDLVAEYLSPHWFPACSSQAPESPAKLKPPREAFNRWLFSGHDESLATEVLDDLPVRLPNWYPTEVAKQRENLTVWRSAMRAWVQRHMPEKIPVSSSHSASSLSAPDDVEKVADAEEQQLKADLSFVFSDSDLEISSCLPSSEQGDEAQRQNMKSDATPGTGPLGAAPKRPATPNEVRTLGMRIIGKVARADAGKVMKVLSSLRQRMAQTAAATLEEVDAAQGGGSYEVTVDFNMQKRLYTLSASRAPSEHSRRSVPFCEPRRASSFSFDSNLDIAQFLDEEVEARHPASTGDLHAERKEVAKADDEEVSSQEADDAGALSLNVWKSRRRRCRDRSITFLVFQFYGRTALPTSPWTGEGVQSSRSLRFQRKRLSLMQTSHK